MSADAVAMTILELPESKSTVLARLARNGENLAVSLALAAMVVLPLAEIVLRKIFHTGISGSTAFVQHFCLIVGMLGGAVAARDDRLVRLAPEEAQGLLLPHGADHERLDVRTEVVFGREHGPAERGHDLGDGHRREHGIGRQRPEASDTVALQVGHGVRAQGRTLRLAHSALLPAVPVLRATNSVPERGQPRVGRALSRARFTLARLWHCAHGRRETSTESVRGPTPCRGCERRFV